MLHHQEFMWRAHRGRSNSAHSKFGVDSSSSPKNCERFCIQKNKVRNVRTSGFNEKFQDKVMMNRNKGVVGCNV